MHLLTPALSAATGHGTEKRIEKRKQEIPESGERVRDTAMGTAQTNSWKQGFTVGQLLAVNGP